MELSEVIASRRSIRKFRQQDISADTIACFWIPQGSPLRGQIFSRAFCCCTIARAKEALGQCTPYKFIIKASVVLSAAPI